MKVYDLKENVTLEQSIDQGIFNSLYNQPYVSAFNISLGVAKDGMFDIDLSFVHTFLSFFFIW